MRACCISAIGKGGAACTEPVAHKGHHHHLLHARSEEGDVGSGYGPDRQAAGQRKALAKMTEDECHQRSMIACANARRLVPHLTEEGHARVGGHICRVHLGLALPGAERLDRHLQPVWGYGQPAHLRTVSPRSSAGRHDDEKPRVRVAGSTANERQPALMAGDHDLDGIQ